MKPTELRIGHIVQISPQTKNKIFAGCLMVVTEAKEFGAQGYVLIPGDPPQLAYLRPRFEDMETVGLAYWVEGQAPEKQISGVQRGR